MTAIKTRSHWEPIEGFPEDEIEELREEGRVKGDLWEIPAVGCLEAEHFSWGWPPSTSIELPDGTHLEVLDQISHEDRDGHLLKVAIMGDPEMVVWVPQHMTDAESPQKEVDER